MARRQPKNQVRRGGTNGRPLAQPNRQPRTGKKRRSPPRRVNGAVPATQRAWRPTSGGIGKITASSERPNRDLLGLLHSLRLKCRTLITSTPQGRAYIRYSLDNILTRRGFSPDYGSDESANLRDDVNGAWREWTHGACSLDGRLSYADLCEMMVQSYLIDGESFVRLHPQVDGLCFEVVDPFRVPTVKRSHDAVMGVNLDENGRPASYLIRDLDDSADPSLSELQVVPAEFILHCANLDFVNQLRGTPPVTVVMEAMKSLDDFRQYALEAARVNAGYIGTLNQQPDAFHDFEGNYDDDEDLDDDGVDEDVRVLDTEGLQMFQAPPGFNLTPFMGKFPDQATDPFLSAMARQIATGLGLAAHNLDGNYSGINYSAGRLAEMSQRLHFDMLRDLFIRRTMDPIYASWLRRMGFPAKRPVWAQADRAQIDPSKEAMTMKTLVGAGIMSRQEAMKQLGFDADEMLAQVEAEGWRNPSDNINGNTTPPPTGDDNESGPPDDVE